MPFLSAREWDDIKAERKRLQDAASAAERELGGLRTQNIQLHRDNSQLAHQMELVIVQLAIANDERVALLRARGVGVQDTPAFHVERPGERPAPGATPLWNGTPIADETAEADRMLAAVADGAAASLFDDPGDDVAAKLGRRHNEFGEVEFIHGR